MPLDRPGGYGLCPYGSDCAVSALGSSRGGSGNLEGLKEDDPSERSVNPREGPLRVPVEDEALELRGCKRGFI